MWNATFAGDSAGFHHRTKFSTVRMSGRKSRMLEPLAFDEYCRFDTSASS